jgi:hypothetical protein
VLVHALIDDVEKAGGVTLFDNQHCRSLPGMRGGKIHTFSEPGSGRVAKR